MRNAPDWFSSRLEFAILIEGLGTSGLASTVVLLQARDWAEAKAKALTHGLAAEGTYLNGEGEEVRWRLVAIDTIDRLGSSIEDGREVYSEFHEPSGPDAYDFDAAFDPASSEPSQSGV